MQANNTGNLNKLKGAGLRLYLWMFAMLIGFTTCIQSFDPEISKYDSLMVIVGELVESDSIQKVEISKSSGYNEKEWLPVSGCVVYVEDDNGNTFSYQEEEQGIYACHIPSQYIKTGVSYRLVVNAGDSSIYVSKYDEMLECPDIDSVYYAFEEKVGDIENQSLVQGVQFYVNVQRDENQAKYCRWSFMETWVYKAYYENNAIIDNGEIIEIKPPVSVPICWMTDEITTSHTAQIENRLKQVELNYVSNETPRLFYRYSLLVRQMGISPGAYAFWNALETQFEDAGSLYEAQPQSITSNITNVENSEEIVIGYFNTASVKEKRIFVDRNMDMSIADYCDFEALPENSDEWPDFAFLYIDNDLPDFIMMTKEYACFDCTIRGGTSVKPDFWED